MSKYIFLEGSPPPNFKNVFERFLFNEAWHRSTQSDGNWNTFSLVNEQAQQVVAQIHFCITHSIAYSPASAPFGSIEFLDSLAPEALFSFWTMMEKKLKSIGVKKMVIKDMANQYRPQQSAMLNVLFLNAGLWISNAEVNSAIAVDEPDFENKISHAQAKRLKRSRQEGLAFRIPSMKMLDEVYSFILACREERGMSLSMTLPQLKRTIQNGKDDFLLFGVFQGHEMIAASISVKVSHRILYDFYHAHPKSVDSLSPVVALIDGMYTYCIQHKFELLDLGTSAVDKQINFSLLNFKAQLGGQPSLKLTFEKDLT